MTQEQCEHAVKILQDKGFSASYVQGGPDDHGVWLDNVWTDSLQEAFSFRIHDDEIDFWTEPWTEQCERLQLRQTHCGGFMYRLIDAWYAADTSNKARLQEAFKNTQFDLT